MNTKITIVDRGWAYALETPDYYDAYALSHADAQQDDQVRAWSRDELNWYAIVPATDDDRRRTVLEAWLSPHDAGHPDVQAEGERRCLARPGGYTSVTWVSVDGPCDVGDEVATDQHGDATVIE